MQVDLRDGAGGVQCQRLRGDQRAGGAAGGVYGGGCERVCVQVDLRRCQPELQCEWVSGGGGVVYGGVACWVSVWERVWEFERAVV